MHDRTGWWSVGAHGSSAYVRRRTEPAVIRQYVGAIVGGWLFRLFGMPEVSGLNIYSTVVAIIGAAVVLLVYHTMFRGFRDRRV